MTFLKRFWPVLLFLALAGCIFYYRQALLSAEEEAESLRARASIAASIEEAEARLADVERREKEVYPRIADALEELRETEAKLVHRRKELDRVKRQAVEEAARARVKVLPPDEVSTAFEALGYPNALVVQP